MLQAGLGVTHCGSIVYGNGISLAVTGIQTQFSGHVLGQQSSSVNKFFGSFFIHLDLDGRRDNTRQISTSEVCDKTLKKIPLLLFNTFTEVCQCADFQRSPSFFFFSVKLHLTGVALKPENVLGWSKALTLVRVKAPANKWRPGQHKCGTPRFNSWL